MGLLLDTSFLIDLEREALGKGGVAATEFLKAHKADELNVSIVTVGEFAAGFTDEAKDIFNSYLSRFPVLPIDREVAWLYGRWSSQLRTSPIGSNDLWIACSGLRNKLPVVTRNKKHFSRVEELEVLTY